MDLRKQTEAIVNEEAQLRSGGGAAGVERQQRLGRLTVRQRLDLLLDDADSFLELGLWAGWQMYPEWGDLPAAGVVTGIGKIEGRQCMVIANDATVKAGAMFPQSVKKVLRAQRIAYECRLPVIYLVDSSGVFLPLQAEVFPDEDDFGRIFRNNAVLSAQGIPQLAAIMGNCIAGGGYLPVLCDKLLMTQGSGLYLAGPALVKAAIGQVVETEELGGAKMHAEVSGTVDFLEPDDPACLERLRSLVKKLPSDVHFDQKWKEPAANISDIYELKQFDAYDLLQRIVDEGSIDEYKKEYGKALVTAYGAICGQPVGIIANQRKTTMTPEGRIEIGGVLYKESADKAARFVMDCNQDKLPLIFLQDVVGFMVGKEAEQSGIIRSGAKLVNVVSNSIVPKITIIIGNSFGAGNYALCGKAYDPNFIFAWPNAKYAVMGGEQAASTLAHIQHKSQEAVKSRYETETDIRFGAARGWVDAVIAPHRTREVLAETLSRQARSPFRQNISHRSTTSIMLRIGNAQGFWGDRPGAAAELAMQEPALDYLTLDYLAELSMSIMAIQKEKDPSGGFARDFLDVLASLAPAWKDGSKLKIITNAGGLNPSGCAKESAEVLKKLGIRKKIAYVAGDDVWRFLHTSPSSYPNLENGDSLTTIHPELATANAYLGAGPIVEALSKGADIVITGRAADVSLTVAPCIYHYKWDMADYRRLAAASIAGHLLECGTQVTGGMSTNWLSIERLSDIGFPFIEMEEDGSFAITKSPFTGGRVSHETVMEQLLYEIGDPDNFITPDVVVSYAALNLKPDGKDRVRISGAIGKPPTDSYKVSASYRDGYKIEAMLVIFGQHAHMKGKLCGKLLLDHVMKAGYHIERSNIECLGNLEVVPGVVFEPVERDVLEVVLRISLASHQKEALEYFAKEVASLVTSGPQGVTGYSSGRSKVRPVFGFWPCLIKKEFLQPKVEFVS